MTDMGPECRAVLSDTLANLRGETSTLEQDRFHAHIERCESCRKSVEAVSEMVETTRHQRFLPTQQQRDDILAGLLEQIRTNSITRDVPVENGWGRRRWLYVTIPLAAAAVFALVVVWSTPEKVPGESDEWDTGLGETMSISRGETLSLDEADMSLGALENRYLANGLTVGVQPGSSFGFSENEHEITVTMEKGGLWIKYTPDRRRRSMVVHGAGVDVRIVGTVLVVRAEPGEVMEVGVYEGRVLVTPDVGDIIALKTKQLRMSDGRVKNMDDQLLSSASSWLTGLETLADSDSSAHGSMGEGRAKVEEATQERRGSMAKQLVSDVEDLYRKADGAMAAGNYKVAAGYLERLVAGHPGSSRADIARLDLARLYTGKLGKPSRAVSHLKAYLKRHPRGSRAQLVNRRLCEIEKKFAIDVAVDCAKFVEVNN